MAKRAKKTKKTKNNNMLLAVLAIVAIVLLAFFSTSIGNFSFALDTPNQCSYSCKIISAENVMYCQPDYACSYSTNDYPVPCIKCNVPKWSLIPLSVESEECKVDPFCTNPVTK